MEGTSEVNDTLDNSAEAPQVKRKENEQSPNPENCNVMEIPALSGSQDNIWPEHLCPMRFLKPPPENLEGENVVRRFGSQPRSKHLGMSLCSNGDGDIIVAELTVTNYKKSRLRLDGCSNSRDDAVKKNEWQKLYKAADDSRDVMSKEAPNIGNEGAGNLYLNQFRSQRPLPHRQKNCSMVSKRSLEGGNFSGSEKNFTDFPGGTRSKILEGYGFPELVVNDSLKGKGIAYKHLGAYDAPQIPVHSSRNEMPRKLLDEVHNLNAKSDGLNLYGDVNCFNSALDPGMSLRGWFNSELHNADKSERFLIFREILELVDSSHSQGIALQDLCPSFFMIRSSNHVKYVGSFISQSPSVSSKVAIDQDALYSVNQLKRKSNLEVDKQVPEVVSVKQQKLIGNLEFGSQCHMFGNKVGRKEASRMNDSARVKVQDSGCNFWPHFLVDEDHKTGSVTSNQEVFRYNIQKPACGIFQLEEMWYTSPENGNGCPFSSNIYSLGVLLFELFCSFESWEVRAAAMVNLRHRILPPRFLSESPKEAGFCLWLLHPEPSLRPKSREILLCEFMCDTQDFTSIDHALASIEDEYAESDMLLHFLLSAKDQKEKRAAKLKEDVRCLRTDIDEVERRNSSRIEPSAHVRSPSAYTCGFPEKNLAESVPSERNSRMSASGISQARLMRNISQLERAYFSTRSKIDVPATDSAARKAKDVLQKHEKCHPTQSISDENCSNKESDRLGAFFDGLCKYARYNKFEVHGTVRNSDILNSANVICSLSFDRDEDYLATAGISKRIKIFDFGALLNDNVDVHYPVVEMFSKSRLSCVCWNSYIKNYLASTDYDGTVQIWDASTGQGFIQYNDHLKRAWSVDFSQGEPTKLASGSDDCSVKLWSIKEKNCISSIRTVANICCVQFSSSSSHLLSFGSADYKVYCYDLRNTRIPWCTLAGHGKTVSYVKFVDSETLVSASTDNTLKLWHLNKTSSTGLSTSACSLTLSGHTNEKNFVGLSVSDGYIACGSETNEVYAYYKSLPMPITSHKFGSIDPITGLEVNEDSGQFVSSVCWRGKSNMVVAANSTGCLKLLKMV
ncbi:unnamed protein product [Spirodela intermedia]|uniref:Uncharacterized protein n=1 Tax=Spirodela intermedia TaxID=51605 RepID=A0A7I8LG79_SPIIN|nr:unnamed protein product [Spirodela intermedia]